MGATLDKFMNKFEEFKTLPAGKSFSIEVSDKEATAAGREFVSENKAWIKQQLKAATGLSLSIENPSIRFGNDELSITVTGGMGFLKKNASLTADVRWNDAPNVHVRTVNVPFVTLSPEKLNGLVEKPLDQLTEKVKEYAEIRSFKLTAGLAVLDAIKK